MTRKSLTIGILGCVLFANGIAADTLDLRNFSDKLKEANALEGIAKGSPEASMLESLNEISQSLQDKELSPEDIDAALTLLESTDLIEESFPKEALFKAGIRPTKRAGRVTKNQYEILTSKIVEVLKEAITEGGTTLKDYSNAEEAPGYFKKKLEVYGRGKQPNW